MTVEMATPDSSTSTSTFQRLALFTTALTYLLITVGAFVRVSGAGMGCPDWPRCFGLLVPPTSAAELPPLGSYSYPPGWRVESFDPLMTWIEFLNRLLGAAVGLAILATLISALASQRRRPGVLWPVVGALVGVLYAAWLGGRVVAHELAPWIVTAHLLSAIAVVSLLVIATVNATPLTTTTPTPLTTTTTNAGRFVSRAAFFVFALALVQGALGTQVRGLIEDVRRHNPDVPRGAWIDLVGVVDIAHRNLALLVVAAVVVLLFVVRGKLPDTRVRHVGVTRAALASVGIVLAQVVVGVALVYADLPRALQVFHLLFGALLLGTLTTTAMLARRA